MFMYMRLMRSRCLDISFSVEYQCITADAYEDRSPYRLSPPATDPVVIDRGSFITYSCYNGMYLPNFSVTLDIVCLTTLDFDYQNDVTLYKCKELCEDPPTVAASTPNSTSTAVHHATLGWWEETIVE